VNDSDQSAELQQLRAQLAELTRRVYHLESLLAARSEPAAAPQAAVSLPSAPSPPPTESVAVPVSSPAPWIFPAPKPVPQATNLPPEGASANAGAQAKPRASLESRIGGQWLNRLGIIAVLVGLSYFLKLAFDNNWIGPVTQVLIGIAAGVALMVWSERFRRKGYTGFAYSLKAVSVGALYLSLWAASQYYHLVPPTVAFFGMVVVTLTSAALSLRQNAELLAAFALVGGFLTPVLISTGQNHEFALFCYLALLDLGTLWITSIKKWQRLLLGSYIGTALLFGAWAETYYNEDQLAATLGFATFFFLLFAAAAFVRDKAPAGELSQLVTMAVVLLNAAGYLAATYLMLLQHHRSQLAWLVLLVGALYFALSRILQKRDGGAYAPVHLALAVGFLSIAIPLKLDGPWITLGWLVEAGALFWAAHRSTSRLLRGLGIAALALGIARLILVDSDAHQPLLLNPRFGLYLVAIAALAMLAYYAMSEGGDENRNWAAAAILTLNVLALLALHFEVMDYFRMEPMQRYNSEALRSLNIMRDFTYSAIWIIYGSALMVIGFWKHSAFLRWQAIALLALTAAKVFFYDIAALERGYRIAAFIVLGAVLLAVSFFYQRSRIKSTQ
jgi:uncharacterized membrane protein